MCNLRKSSLQIRHILFVILNVTSNLFFEDINNKKTNHFKIFVFILFIQTDLSYLKPIYNNINLRYRYIKLSGLLSN